MTISIEQGTREKVLFKHFLDGLPQSVKLPDIIPKETSNNAWAKSPKMSSKWELMKIRLKDALWVLWLCSSDTAETDILGNVSWLK